MKIKDIKFRAWDMKYKSWVYSNHINGLLWFFLLLSEGKYDIMRATGVLDKRKREIYEGDIVKVIYPRDRYVKKSKPFIYTGEVKWFPGQFEIWNKKHYIDLLGNSEYPPKKDDKFSIEIIGNIYRK